MSTSDFKMIRPVSMIDSILTSSNVTEATVTEYAGGTTYAAGDIRGVTTGTTQLVYISLQAANTGHTPASSPTWWEYLDTVYAAYAGGTSYSLGDIVSSVSTNVHLLYQSLANTNSGNALTDATKWLPLGSTNRWAMFDQAVNSQTTKEDSIILTLTPGQIINAITMLNTQAATITVAQSVSGYSKTVNMNSHAVLNWYDWYYEPVLRTGDVVFDDIPPYAASVLTVTISNPGDLAACGLFQIGTTRILGTTVWEFYGEIISYSGTTTDAFGNTTIVKRANAKRLTFEVKIAAGFESEAYRLLKLYEDTPMIFVGSTNYAMSIVYGFLGQWQVPVSIAGKLAQIEIRGMI